MTVVDDLAAWLTQIWDEREREASDPYWNTTDGLVSSGEVLARIAADRQVVAEYVARDRDVDLMLGPPIQRQREWIGLRLAVRILASAYADRPGYQEAWRPA